MLAYGVASVSGTILAVCSCTVLPLFAGMWRMGAGLGPASAFLYSGPAINLQGLIGSGMGQGPALALLLAGPALSLQSMLVLRSVMGAKKTVIYVVLVVVMATITGLIYGTIIG